MKYDQKESLVEKLNEANEKKTWMSPTIEHWEHIHIEISQGGGVDSGHSAYIV